MPARLETRGTCAPLAGIGRGVMACAARAALPTPPVRRDSAPVLRRTGRKRTANNRCCSSLPVRAVRAGSDADRRWTDRWGQAWARRKSNGGKA
ncbi:hypothetical protein C7S14_0293 [Burkholderia cepacia]|nr:hypothetical protein C7S14_0293 [Burkholderia cepacia]